MSVLGGGSAKNTPAPPPSAPHPTEAKESVQNAAMTEKRRIAAMYGRNKTILSMGNTAKPSILKAKLGQS